MDTSNRAAPPPLGSGEETRGPETVRSLRKKDALGRPCNYNGSCPSQQQVPTRLLLLVSTSQQVSNTDKSCEPWKEKFKNDDGIELMIPAQNPDLVPDIIYSWIKRKLIDIEPELRAAQVRCTCSICYPSHPDPKDAGESSTARKGKQGAGESSTTGKGKQPASPAQAAASPGFPQPAMNMNRSFLDTLKAAPTRQPSQAAASSGFSQPAIMNMNRSFLDTLKAAPTRHPSQAAPLGSGEETRGAETVRSLRKDAFGRPCNYNGSCASQQVPTRLLLLASGDSSSLQKYQGTNKESGHWVLKDELDDFNTSYVWFPKKWPMDISLEDLLYLHDAKAASLLEDKTTVSGEVDCGKAMKGCVASFPMLLHDRSERREALLFGFRTLPPPLDNAAKVGDATKSDSVLVSIFVRPVSGEPLVLTVKLDESSQHMMCLYAQKTNTKLELQYFIYGRKRLEPDCTLLSYGVKANSTINACTWLLGGAVTMSNYLADKQDKFLVEVTLPNGDVSLEMTKIGCLFLSTWLKCFTRAFANSKSWNGNFTKESFKVARGHVLVNTGADANVRLDSSSMKADMARLVQYIREIFSRNNSNLVSKFPPYMENLITFLGSMGSPMLYKPDRLFIETHVCCVESAARGVLLVMVQRKFKSLNNSDQKHWIDVMQEIDPEKTYVSAEDLSGVPVFQDIITKASNRGESYGSSKPSIFRLMRDHFIHAPSHRFDKSSKPWSEKFKNDDGIELMIPAHNKDFLPEIIYCMIKDKKFGIEAELLAAQVRCTCHICHPSHSGSKGAGESSTAGRGQQPESPGPSTPSSMQGPSYRSVLRGSRPPAPTQPAVPRAPAPTQQSSSSDWQTSTRKGKGKI